MTVWTPTITPVMGQTNIDGWQVVWGPGMLEGDTGAPVGSTIGGGSSAIVASGGGLMTGFIDKTIQVTGLTGSETVQLQGSNDGVNFADLSDPQGNALAITSAGPLIKQIEEAVIQVRPAIVSGSGSAQLAVIMFARKTQAP